ncbi:hypothetical protein JCM11491_001366 [Sporobolomyces phaffii]
MTESAAFSILRIKRKRTANQLPLDALVIEQPEPSTKRRKATHASAPAAPPASRGIFRFAETVSLDSFDNPTKTRQVKDRIQSFLTKAPTSAAVSNLQKEQRPLARIPSSASLRTRPASSSASASPSPASTPTSASKSGRKLPSSAAALVSHSSRSSNPPPPFPFAPAPLERKRTRYRIVTESAPPPPSSSSSSSNAAAAAAAAVTDPARGPGATTTMTPAELEQRARDDDEYLADVQEDLAVRRGLRPPRVSSRAELDARAARDARRAQRALDDLALSRGTTRIYDAIAEDDDDDDEVAARSVKKKVRRESRTKKGGAKNRIVDDEEEDQAMMDNFGDMLKEYLTLQDSTERDHASRSLATSSAFSPTIPIPAAASTEPSDDEEGEGEESDSGGDFVYDVYYRDLRDTTAAAVGPTTSNALEGGSNSDDVSSLEGLKRIGALAGLEEDEDLLLRVDGEGDSESEEEDNADQDSNEENDYRNDYPDEESEDEDRWNQDGEGEDDDDGDDSLRDDEDDY